MWNKMVNILIQLSNKGTFCKMTQRITMISVNIKKKKLFHKDIFSQCFPNLPSQTTLYFCDVNNVHANKLSTTRRVKCIPPPSKTLDYLVACQTVNQYLSQYCSYSCYIIYICGHSAWFPRLDVQSAHSSHRPHSKAFSTTFGVCIWSIQCPRRPSSSPPHPEQRAQWVSDQVSHASPSIWRHSGPDTQLPPLKVLPPCNEAEHTSCDMHWSCCMRKKTQDRWDATHLVL